MQVNQHTFQGGDISVVRVLKFALLEEFDILPQTNYVQAAN